MYRDWGYSNWTVTDTTIACLASLNKHLPSMESYRWETDASPVFKVAETCNCFSPPSEGKVQIHIDVDQNKLPLMTELYDVDVLWMVESRGIAWLMNETDYDLCSANQLIVDKLLTSP